MSTDLATITAGKDFKTLIKDKVLGALMDLIPEEKLMEMVNGEIKAFFECESIVAVQQGKIQIDNPMYDKSKHSGYGNEKTITKECMTLNMKMTPFRQLVWTTLYEYLSNKIIDVITSETSAVNADIAKWFEEEAKGELVGTHKSLINKYVMTGSMGIMSGIITNANMNAKATVLSALAQAGVNTGNINI